MTKPKCMATIAFDATTERGEWYPIGKFPKAEFECVKEAGHKGPHHSYGSHSINGKIVTNYALDWGAPTVEAKVSEVKE